MITKPFRIICATPPAQGDPSIAIAAGRAGALGVLDLSFARDAQVAAEAMERLARHGRGDLGIKLDAADPDLAARLARDLPAAVRTIILAAVDPASAAEAVRSIKREGVALL